MDLLLDTCTVLWAAGEPNKLSERAVQVLEAPDSVIYVSSVTAAELACAVERDRIRLTEHWKPWFRRCLRVNGWNCVPLDLDVIEEAYSLPPPFHQDPVDRMLVATARLRRLTIITGDPRILAYPHVATDW